MQRGQHGFSIVEILIVSLVAGLIVTGAFVVLSAQRKDTAMNGASHGETSALLAAAPELTHWPVRIDDFNAETHLAGDVYMNDTVLLGTLARPVDEFGREQIKDGQAEASKNASIYFLTRADAPVYAASNGYVFAIDQQQDKSAYTVHVAPGKAQTTRWAIVYHHLSNLKVKVGDSVVAGAPIGTAGPYDGRPYSTIGFQIVQYPVSNTQGGGEARCPSAFIASGAKRRMTNEFLLLTKAWETQAASGGIYNEPAWTRLGCVADKAVP